MLYLVPFDKFPFDDFVKEKKLMVAGVRPWFDYNTKERLGTQVKVSVEEDNSQYPPTSTGEIRDNFREVFTVKVLKEKVNVKRNDFVRFIGVDASIVGDFRNELKITAEDVVLDTSIKADVSDDTSVDKKTEAKK